MIDTIGKDEVSRVMEVWEASVRATHDFLTDADIEGLKPLLPGYLGAVDLWGVRDDEGRVVAFLGVVDRNVEMLFIHPSHRGRGIGRELMEFAVDGLGAQTVDVNEQNEQAVGFYRHIGFEVTGRSELDGQGNPFPLLHMRVTRSADS
jgi:putative acetyltransferase